MTYDLDLDLDFDLDLDLDLDSSEWLSRSTLQTLPNTAKL